MPLWSRIRHVWQQLVYGRRVDRDLDDELAAYVALAADERASRGLSPEEARRRVLAEAGGLQQVKERVRDVRTTSFIEPIVQDARHALRQMWRAPGFTAAAVAAIALGIGATAATVSIVDAVLLRPLAYKDAGDLVVVMHERSNPVAPANFFDWRRQARSFAGMAAAEYWTPNLGGRDPQKLLGLRVTPDMFPLLGIAPAMGRTLSSDAMGSREVVLGTGLWLRQFGGDPAVLGTTLTLDGEPYAVVGIMPPDFRFAPFWATRAELWATLDLSSRATSRSGQSLRIFARLAPGVSVNAAEDEMTTIAGALEREFPGTNQDVAVTPLQDIVVGDVRQPILAVLCAVGLVLLVASANVAHMLLARASAREREVAVRAALGADRWRLARQFLTESVSLGLVGGAAGVGLAYLGLDLLVTLAGSSVPRVEGASMNGTVLAFALVLSLVTGLLFGLAPAFRSRRTGVTTLREGERGSTVGRRTIRTRGLLIASEIALASLLLVGAGLMIRSFIALSSIDPGWKPERLLSMVVSVSGSAELAPGRRTIFYQEALAKVRVLRGVEAASAINHLPIAGDIWGVNFFIDGRPRPAPGAAPNATYRSVLPGYFETVGLPIVRGRGFSAQDDLGRPNVAIVNEHLVDTYWPGEDALGKTMQFEFGSAEPPLTIVGVARNAVRGDWVEPPAPELYVPVLQNEMLRENPASYASYLTFVVRTSGDPSLAVAGVRSRIREVAPDVTISDVLLMRDVVSTATAGPRFLVVLLTGFAVVALVLAAVGVYGVMSYVVAGRRQEIGIRIALGASPRDVLMQVVEQGMAMAAAGILAGALAALAVSRLIAGLIFGVTATDPIVFVTVPVALGTVALLASFGPAWRASRVDPLRELR